MLKPYPAMKHSGVEWLGEVPAHWQVRRLRNVAGILFSNVDKHSKDDESPVRLCNYLDVYYNDRIRSDMDFMKATATADEIEQYRLVVGDVLITKDSESWDDIGVPAFVENTDHDVICGYHLALLRSIRDEIAGEYLYHALTCQGVADQLYVRANGVTRFGLSQTAIKSASLPVPSFPEQIAITRFLDHVNSRIDRYIRAKEKLIALLEEQKRAIIHQAVTGRIDVRTGRPYPAYKPSGVKWLGDVPAHWAARRLKTVCRIRYGLGQPPPEAPNGLPLIRATNVNRGKITKKDLLYVDASGVPASREAILREGEIIIVRSGAYTADSAIVPRAYAGAVTGYDLVADVVGALPEFVAAALLSSYLRDDQLVVESTRSAQPHLNAEELGSAVLLLPLRLEQSRIVDHLDQANAANDSKIADANRQIALLREYRTRLIADVVTGKLDVRSAAAQLPESMPDMDEDRVDAVQADDDNEPAEVVR